jgi:putative Mg2+ transporter-C (MgtC) family protein
MEMEVRMDFNKIVLRVLFALIIGGITGLERERSNQFAGFRTHTLVSICSCMVSIMSLLTFNEFSSVTNMDPTRLTAQVLSGVGFLGAGAILKTNNGVKGLTTAASVWLTAVIGISIGYGYLQLSLTVWLSLMITLYVFKLFERSIFKKKKKKIDIIIADEKVFTDIFNMMQVDNVKITNMCIESISDEMYKVKLTLKHSKSLLFFNFIEHLNKIDGVVEIITK